MINQKNFKSFRSIFNFKKVYSTKGIDILIAEKDFNNKDDFNVQKLNQIIEKF